MSDGGECEVSGCVVVVVVAVRQKLSYNGGGGGGGNVSICLGRFGVG